VAFSSRLNGNTFLLSDLTASSGQATVFDDSSADQLSGSSSRDFFFADLGGGADQVADAIADATTSGGKKETVVNV
jgi:hypothetical protein